MSEHDQDVSAGRLEHLEQLALLLAPYTRPNESLYETVQRFVSAQEQLRERIALWRDDADLDCSLTLSRCADEVECILNLL